MLQVQRLSLFLLPSAICGLEVVPVHKDLSAIVAPIEIVIPANGTLFSAIGTLWQKLVLQYQSVFLPIRLFDVQCYAVVA